MITKIKNSVHGSSTNNSQDRDSTVIQELNHDLHAIDIRSTLDNY